MTKVDHLTDCPRCHSKAEKEIGPIRARNKAALDTAYGALTRDEYDKLMRNSPRKEYVLTETMRETLIVCLDFDGILTIRYRCACNAPGCGFAHEFRHEENVEL